MFIIYLGEKRDPIGAKANGRKLHKNIIIFGVWMDNGMENDMDNGMERISRQMFLIFVLELICSFIFLKNVLLQYKTKITFRYVNLNFSR